MESKLEVFKQEYCFTKEDIQNAFSEFVKYNFIENNEEQYSINYLKKILELCEEFKEALDNSHLPEMTDDWWYYDFEVKNDSIELNLYFCDELELDKSGEISGSASTKISHFLL